MTSRLSSKMTSDTAAPSPSPARRTPRSAHWLLGFYPASWRARYGDEFAALLADCPLTLFGVADVLLGALDAHLAPQDTTGRILRMLNQPRRTAIAVFSAYILYVIGGIGFQKMSEYDDFSAAAHAYPLINIGYITLYIGAIVSLLAVLAGGLPLALAALRFAWVNRRWDIPLLLSVPVFAFAALFGYIQLLLHVIGPATRTTSIHDRAGPFQLGTLVAVFLFLAIVSTVAVSLAVARSQIDQRLLRFTYLPAIVTTLAMALTVAGLIVWGLAIRADVPALWNGNNGLGATSTALSWANDVALMILATLIALGALIWGRSRQRVAAQPA